MQIAGCTYFISLNVFGSGISKFVLLNSLFRAESQAGLAFDEGIVRFQEIAVKTFSPSLLISP